MNKLPRAFAKPSRFLTGPRWLCVLLLGAASCGGGSGGTGFHVVARHPHDSASFTQGLAIGPGNTLFESTGLVGESTLRIVEKQSGKTVQRVAVDPPHFGEGIAIHGREIVMLTWQTGIAFRFDRESLVPLGTFRYDGEGWGLACDGKYFFRSDGTSRIRLHNPADFKTVSDFRVVDRGRPVERLNELEFVRGELWANVWKTDRIVRINPQTGRVVGWVDLKDVYPQSERPAAADVMNGIAWDSQSGHVLVTGKRWPWLFELEVR